MIWAEYYERYDRWQESTQYSRLASIEDFGQDGSPTEEICDCIQYVDTRTATSILRRALAAGVRFRAAEVTEIADSGQIDDEELLEKLIQTSVDAYTGDQLDTLLSCLADPDESDEEIPPKVPQAKKSGLFSSILMGMALAGSPKPESTGRCQGDCAHCPPHYGYRYGRWYYGHGHTHGCEFGGNGGRSGKCNID